MSQFRLRMEQQVMEASVIVVVSYDGPAVQIVDLALCRARTRRYPHGRVDHVLEELRTAAAQDRAQMTAGRGVITI